MQGRSESQHLTGCRQGGEARGRSEQREQRRWDEMGGCCGLAGQEARERWVEVEFDLGGRRREEELGGVFRQCGCVSAGMPLSGRAAWWVLNG